MLTATQPGNVAGDGQALGGAATTVEGHHATEHRQRSRVSYIYVVQENDNLKSWNVASAVFLRNKIFLVGNADLLWNEQKRRRALDQTYGPDA